MARSHNIITVKCRGKPVGYRAYIGGKYHSYHKTQALAQAAIKRAIKVANNGLGSTPRPKTKAKAMAGLGSIPRPKTKAKANAKQVPSGSRRKNETMAELGSTPRPQAVLFKGLVPWFSVRTGQWMYQGRVRQPGTDTKLYIGSSASQKTLASKIAKATGNQEVLPMRKKCDRRPVTDTLERFQMLTVIFKGWRPRDLTGAVQRRGQAAMMIAQAPGMYVAFLMGREHSWRDAVLNTWEATDYAQRLSIAGLDSNDEPMQLEASTAMHNILSDAFAEWARQTLSHPEQWRDWKTHVDRNVSHHLSLTAWGLREGLLMKKSTRGKSLGVQNKAGEWYGLCAYNRQEHHVRILQMHRLGRMLLQMQVPRTNREWLESIEGFGKRCYDAGINTGQREDNYQFWWLARSYLIVEMRHQGIERLRVTDDWDKDQIAASMVPDMNEWLSAWMTSKEVGARSLKPLLSKLVYREPLELLSCFCCILGDGLIDQYSIDALDSARDAINKERKQMREASAFKDEGHPALILQKAMASQAQG